jgi:tRNA-2-methylthio-N6-dimethylallyladenosine synthase
MDGHVPEDVKTERLERLQALIREQQVAFQESFVGRDTEVLIEKPGRHPGQMIGRSPFLLPVVVPSSAGEVGDIVTVRISETRPNSLMAAGAEPAVMAAGAEPVVSAPAASEPQLRKIA